MARGAGDVESVMDGLLEVTGASRTTIRQDRPPSVFPVTFERLTAGAPSILGVETPNMPRQPVVVRVLAGEQVIQNDCPAASDDPDFQTMLELYGGLRAQIGTPIERDGELQGVLSLHQLGTTRSWTTEEVLLCRTAASELARLL